MREQLARAGGLGGLFDLVPALSPRGLVGLVDRGVDLVLAGAVEDGRERLEAEHGRGPAEVDLEDLPDVHARRARRAG